VFFALAVACLSRRASERAQTPRGSVHAELAALARSPPALAVVAAFVLGVLWLIDGTTKWSERIAAFWVYASPASRSRSGSSS
jgi:hypothetical protein